jgi:diguanylate cyclase (GGDEF)-like protein
MDQSENHLKTVLAHLDFASCLMRNNTVVFVNDLFKSNLQEQEISALLQSETEGSRDWVHKGTGTYYSVKRISLDKELKVLFFIERKEVRLVTDPLTGLLHRETFPRLSQQVLDEGKAQAKIIGFLFIDLDGFKAVNDTWGHDNGDLVLRETAVRISHVIRGNDHGFRMGGDEFVILLDGVKDRMHSCLVARRLISAISEPIALSSEVQVRIGASIGISTFPSDGNEVEDLLQKSDEAMYRAKKLGKNSYQLHG